THAMGAELLHTRDAVRVQKYYDRVNDLRRQGLTENELIKKFTHTARTERPRDDDGEMNRKMVGELFDNTAMHGAFLPALQKAILDTTGSYSSGGSVFIRQDLEPIFHSLFVQKFPFFEMLQSKQSNGLVHVANQITATDSNAIGSTIVTETGSIPYSAGVYN